MESSIDYILQRELCLMQQSEASEAFSVELMNSDLRHWRVAMDSTTFSGPLAGDLDRFAVRYNQDPEVVFDVKFSDDYPNQPPVVRVVRPRFQYRTGHVSLSGAMCAEVLTTGGGQHQWRPDISCEVLMVMLHSMLEAGNGRVDFVPIPNADYTEADAAADFNRIARRHGWSY